MPQGREEYERVVSTRDRSPPRVLYKYASADVAKTILTSGTLRFSSPTCFNDPEDTQWDPLWQLSTPESARLEREIFVQALLIEESWPIDSDRSHRTAFRRERESVLKLNPLERSRAIQEYVTELQLRPRDREGFDLAMASIRERLRICCFSEDDLNHLMWAHYADKHAGIVLGFDSRALEISQARPLEPVIYTDTPPQLFDLRAWHNAIFFGTSSAIQPEALGRRWALVKHRPWEYEREWRFVWIEPKGTAGTFMDHQIPSRTLVEVIAGRKTKPDDKRAIFELAKSFSPAIRCSVAVGAEGSFALRRDEET